MRITLTLHYASEVVFEMILELLAAHRVDRVPFEYPGVLLELLTVHLEHVTGADSIYTLLAFF